MHLRILALLAAVAAALVVAFSASASTPPPVDARAVIVADGRTGDVLYAENADRRMAMASITKLMTALVTLEHARPGGVVTVSPRAIGKGGSSIFLTAGEQLTVRDLLAAALIQSANDAAFALAAHVGDGSVPRFVQLMNEKAAELGLEDTHFVRPDGLDTPGHFSSAEDVLALSHRDAASARAQARPQEDHADRRPAHAEELERPALAGAGSRRRQDRAHRQRRLGAGRGRQARADERLRRHPGQPGPRAAQRRPDGARRVEL